MSRAEEMDAWRIGSSGGEPEPLTQTGATVSSLAPLDARTMLYTARDDDGSGPWLWALDVDTKTTHRVSSGLEQYTWIAATADGRRLVASVASPRATLWSVPTLDRLVRARDAQPYPVPSVRALAPRVRGTSVFYLSALGDGRRAVALPERTGAGDLAWLAGRAAGRHQRSLPMASASSSGSDRARGGP